MLAGEQEWTEDFVKKRIYSENQLLTHSASPPISGVLSVHKTVRILYFIRRAIL